MAGGGHSSSITRSSLLSTSSWRSRIRERLLIESWITNLIRNARMKPQPPLLAGASVRFVRIMSGRAAGAVSSPTSLGRTALSPSDHARKLAHQRQRFVHRGHRRLAPATFRLLIWVRSSVLFSLVEHFHLRHVPDLHDCPAGAVATSQGRPPVRQHQGPEVVVRSVRASSLGLSPSRPAPLRQTAFWALRQVGV